MTQDHPPIVDKASHHHRLEKQSPTIIDFRTLPIVLSGAIGLLWSGVGSSLFRGSCWRSTSGRAWLWGELVWWFCWEYRPPQVLYSARILLPPERFRARRSRGRWWFLGRHTPPCPAGLLCRKQRGWFGDSEVVYVRRHGWGAPGGGRAR